jgi:hypothetical protein
VATTGAPEAATPTDQPTVTSTPTDTPTSTTTSTPTDTPSSAPTETVAPTAYPGCDCSGDNLNCGSFGSQIEAQLCYQYCVDQGQGDIHVLDGDDDKQACNGYEY